MLNRVQHDEVGVVRASFFSAPKPSLFFFPPFTTPVNRFKEICEK
jgi:hypothetical protein